MITASGPEQIVLNAKTYREYLRVEVKDAGGSWVNYELIDFQYRAEIVIDVDARIAQATVELVRESSGNSIAPLVNTDIAVGRDIRISAARVAAGASPGPSDYKSLFVGTVDEWGHPTVDGEADDNRLTLVARDGLAVLQDRWIEEETVYSTADGLPLETVMQNILNDWADGITLYVPAPTGTMAGIYRQEKRSVLDALQTLADLIGWVIEWRWDNGSGTWRVTLYEPNRTPSGTDWTFGPDDYYAVDNLAVARYHIRNAVTVRYSNAANDGERDVYTAEDPTSIAKYGRRWMEIEEADDSPINSPTLAQGMADPALLDLSEPDALQEIRGPLFWPVQLGDYYEFEANFVHYDVDQQFGVVGYTHVLENGAGETRIRTRGKPVGSVRGWLRREHRIRPPSEAARALEILDFREIARTSTEITYAWRLGSDLAQSWIHDYKEPQPYANDKWPGPDRPPDLILDDRDVTYVLTIPEQGYVGYFQVEGRRADKSLGDVERVLVFPSNVAGDYIAFAVATVDQTTGAVIITGWTTDRAKSVAFAYNVGDATVAPPTEAQTEAQGAGATGGGLVSGFTSDFEIILPPGTLAYGETIKGMLLAYINANGTGPDGTAQDHDVPVGFQGERFKLTASDQIADGIVISRALTESSRDFMFPALTFQAFDWDTVTWSAFTLQLAGGTAYSIISGSVDMTSAAPAYVYFDPTISTTQLQVTTDFATATGERRLLLAVTQRAPASNQDALVIPAVGVLGINETVIGPNSVTTGHLQASSIQTFHLNAGIVKAANIDVAYLRAITADAGWLRSGYISNPGNTAALRLSTASDDPTAPAGMPTTNFIDFTATSAAPFLSHPALVLLANGNATFSGVVAATSFTGASALFDAYVQVRNVSAISPPAEFRQDRVVLTNGVSQSTILANFTSVAVLQIDSHVELQAGASINAGAGTQAITRGDADSGGSGFRVLRVPN